MADSITLTDTQKRIVLDDMKKSLNPAEITNDKVLAKRVTKIASNVVQIAKAAKSTSDLSFSVNLVDFAADCVATHLESSDPNRELFHELVIANEVSMTSWCPGGYEQLIEITSACIPARIGFLRYVTLKDLQERTSQREETPRKERKKRGFNQLNKSAVVVPRKITAPEATQNHKVNMERARDVLIQHTENSPLPFYRFVINPKSFVQTVYNIFITSFLVHEQHAVLSVGENYELFIQRATEPANDERPLEDARNIQLVTSINALQWQGLVKHLRITSAMLPEFCPKVSQYFLNNQLGDDLAEGVTFLDP